MVSKALKFIEKSKYKDRLLEAVSAIFHNDFEGFDTKQLQGRKEHFRIRIGKVRIIFTKTTTGNKIIAIDNRGDIY